MRVIIKNNKQDKVDNKTTEKIVRFYLNKLLDNDVSGISTLTITFKKLKYNRGGSAGFKRLESKEFHIILNSTKEASQTYKTLAHECTHLKQYVTRELTFSHKYSRAGRRQTITTWKGRSYMRKAYLKQPWEVDARKGEKMAWNILNKIDAPAKVITKAPEPVKVEPVVLSGSIADSIRAILKGGEIPNGELVKMVLNGDKDKAKTLKVLREVFNLKQTNVIREVIKDSLVWVELV